ncbi:hypothetical protein NEFER03_2055 [Nematocida sp. LUAm3]|nr:hypothetical protein NEFER03_2055 [Nematocida sp. LUAm3]KAI5176227.1 hypothetical protein NEFER02_2033 [Nematocida sp. LUAm2]KAI5179215.1 hypothetical protein NEFER01_2072 [Nematocida sp. LUAm1]
MKISLEKEKRRRYAVTCTWKVLVHFMVLVNLVFSMGSCFKKFRHAREVDVEQGIGYTTQYSSLINRENVTEVNSENDIEMIDDVIKEKREIAKALVDYFDIMPNNCAYLDYLTEKLLYTKIEHDQFSKHFYIDLANHQIRKRRPVAEEPDIRPILQKIKSIRCKNVLITPTMPCETVEPLIARIVIENELCIQGIQSSVDLNPELPINVVNLDPQDTSLESPWDVATPIILLIKDCAHKIVDFLLNWASSREIQKLVIKYMQFGMDLLNLGENKITKNCPIILYDLPDIKNLVLPQAQNNTYEYIELFGIPMLQEIITKNASSSNIIVKNFWINEQTFISLVTAYKLKSEDPNSAIQVLQVQNLHIYDMTHTFIKTEGISSLWMEVENVTIYIEYCDDCDMPKEDIIPRGCSIKNFVGVGICCKKSPVYKPFSDLPITIMKDKYACSTAFIKRNVMDFYPIHIESFKCPKKTLSYTLLPPLNIELKNTKEIQETIKQFRSKYSMISIHAQYTRINIYGSMSNSPEENIALLKSAMACMGLRIQGKIIAFYDIKGIPGIDIQEQHPLLRKNPFKTKFILKRLHFYNSDENFINSVVSSYDHTLVQESFVDDTALVRKNVKKTIRVTAV